MTFTEFLTVTELDAKLRRMSEPVSLGKSSSGYDIMCAKIGSGTRTALVFGFPHANEPVGSLTCLHLIKLINENHELSQAYTWYIVPCADPDGAKLNEGWFKGSFTISKYAKNFYRGKPSEQTDWGFPIKYKDFEFKDSPAHVKVLARFIEQIKPEVVYPIHNAGFGGAYFFVGRAMPEQYYDELIALCNKLEIPMDMGEPEEAFMKSLKKPVYLDFGFEDYYEFNKANGQDPTKVLYHGTTSKAYARKFNPSSFGLVGEVPYIYDPKTQDNSLTMITRRQNILDDLNVREKLIEFVSNALVLEGIDRKSIFFDTLTTYAKNARTRMQIERENAKKAEYGQMATVAEIFTTQVITQFYYALKYGELYRLLNTSKKTEPLKLLLQNVEKEINNIESFIQNNSTFKTFPINKMIQLQTEFLLITLKYLNP